MKTLMPFHYAFKVSSLADARRFYMDILGCEEGRSTKTWVDFSFFGHQLSAHLSTSIPEPDYCGEVDGTKVPIPHFGCLLSLVQFREVQKKLESAGIEFIVKPQLRYKGKTGEQLTMFVRDLSGNPIEFKAFSDDKAVFEG